MRKFFIYFSLAIFTTMGIYVMITAEVLPKTYDGRNTNINEILADNKKYSMENIDGTADGVVKKSLDKTRALNVVNAVLMDFRGYDALGQTLILATAITGCALMLRIEKRESGKSDEEEYKD